MRFLPISALLILLGGCRGGHPLQPLHTQPAKPPMQKTVIGLIAQENPTYRVLLESFSEQLDASLEIYAIPKDQKRLLRLLRAKQPDLIFTVGRGATLFAREALPEHPQLFCMVPNHEQYPALLEDEEVMGVSLEPAASAEFVKFKLVVPRLERVLTFYNPSESGARIERATDDLSALGIELIAEPISSQDELEARFGTRRNGVDAIWLNNDRLMANQPAFDFLKARTVAHRLPLLTSLTDAYAAAGAMLSVGVDLHSMGSQAGVMANAYLKGHRTVASFAIQPPAGTTLALNEETAERIGAKLRDNAVLFIDRFYPE